MTCLKAKDRTAISAGHFWCRNRLYNLVPDRNRRRTKRCPALLETAYAAVRKFRKGRLLLSKLSLYYLSSLLTISHRYCTIGRNVNRSKGDENAQLPQIFKELRRLSEGDARDFSFRRFAEQRTGVDVGEVPARADDVDVAAEFPLRSDVHRSLRLRGVVVDVLHAVSCL